VIADIALELVVDPQFDAVLDFFVQATGSSIWDGAGNETALAASAHQLATAEAAAFNERYPDAAGIPYWSIGGRSDLHPGGERCAADMPPFIAAWTMTLDPIDAKMLVTEAILDGQWLFPEPNDGLVTVESARWTGFLGCVPADHFDEMGQLLGDEPGLGNAWDHREFYAELIAWLRARNL
jgi:triacylglycerol lipase